LPGEDTQDQRFTTVFSVQIIVNIERVDLSFPTLADAQWFADRNIPGIRKCNLDRSQYPIIHTSSLPLFLSVSKFVIYRLHGASQFQVPIITKVIDKQRRYALDAALVPGIQIPLDTILMGMS
jgi:hypothetical protein